MGKTNKNKSDITVIIPIHKLDEVTLASLSLAVESVVSQKVAADELLFVVTPEVKDKVNGIDWKAKGLDEFRVLVNEGDSSFQSQMNLGVSEVKTKWFTVLEFDDVQLPIFMSNAVKYIAANEDVSIFLPIVVEANTKNEAIGISNEAVWAHQFCEAEELGFLDIQTLLSYSNFSINGMIVSKDKYEAAGGFKPTLKQVFGYEFLLRMLHMSNRLMVIPKYLYKHINGRADSLFDEYSKTITMEENKFWLGLAKKEYFHVKDRGITYEQK